MPVAAAVARTAEDVDGDLASGTSNAESIAAMAGADESLQRCDGSRELQSDGEGGSRRVRRPRWRRGKNRRRWTAGRCRWGPTPAERVSR